MMKKYLGPNQTPFPLASVVVNITGNTTSCGGCRAIAGRVLSWSHPHENTSLEKTLLLAALI